MSCITRPSTRTWFGLPTVAVTVMAFAITLHAGGPEYVAGSSYFISGTMGQPVTWSSGQVNFYTDLGDLSPILSNSAANALVASAVQQWSSVAAANLAISAAGELAEDVNGDNIAVNSAGVVTAPSDITPSATQKPVGIVYDYDGSVTNALLGDGAGSASQCFWNAVYGGPDNFGTGANFAHALVVVNGQCALQSSQLTDVEYRLVRVLGKVLGLGWSQLNLNVITGQPPPTADDFAGFPVMHDVDPVTCVPITACYANPYQLTADDTAALSRLYPLGDPPGTARIYGSVYFSNQSGGPGQPMEGVNVIARWIDPATNLPSHRYAASSVSGFLFTGNAGNAITGLIDPLGNAYSNFGSDNTTVEGFFDLGGLPIPNAAGTAQYQLSIEALDPSWSAKVCPYTDGQVAPSGTFMPITVTLAAGGEFEQDIQMKGSAQPEPPWAASETWSAPANVNAAGDWIGSLSGYGDAAYFMLAAQANRTFSIAVTALDESGAPTESKVEPVMGVWTLGDAQGTTPPAFTVTPFNSETFAMSRLDAQVLSTENFIFGIADLRGDGRPDYHYHAHVLYGDSASPARAPVSGGVIVLQGTGFAPGLTVSADGKNLPVIATDAGQILAAIPAAPDGPVNLTITDPVTGAFSIMSGALTLGAAATDQLLPIWGASNPQTPLGTQAQNPLIARVVASDGVTPVWGATVGWNGTNQASLSACGGGAACSVTTDQSGTASTSVTPMAAGVATITATLAPGVYSRAQSAWATVDGTSGSQSIGLTTPYLWIVQGASVNVPITARVVNSAGSPQSGITVSFAVTQGTASLSSGIAATDSAGDATVTLSLTNFNSTVQLSACLGSGPPCVTVYGNPVAPTLLNLQAVAGGRQVVVGSNFQPVTLRVIDSSTPPNPVLGASVLFQSVVLRPPGNGLAIAAGDSSSNQTGAPIILSAGQVVAQSDGNGLASFMPTTGSFSGLLEIEIQISAGAFAVIQDLLETFP